jgi:hypothetical protein
MEAERVKKYRGVTRKSTGQQPAASKKKKTMAYELPDKKGDIYVEMTQRHVVLKHPFTMLVAGPTCSGKTWWVKKLLKHKKEMIFPKVHEVIWYHGQSQKYHETIKDENPDIQFVKGFPIMADFDDEIPKLIIIDDLMNTTDGSDVMTDLFTKGAHHTNTSVIYIVQNIFNKKRDHRTVSLNAHYMVIMKNPRDNVQIAHLGRQMYPGNGSFIQDCYMDATDKPYGYLFIDFKQETPQLVRVRREIFPDEHNYIYLEA